MRIVANHENPRSATLAYKLDAQEETTSLRELEKMEQKLKDRLVEFRAQIKEAKNLLDIKE